MLAKNLSGYFAVFMLIVFPISVLLIKDLPGLIFVIAMFWGAYYLLSNKYSISPISKDEQLFFMALIPLYVSAWISAYFNDAGIYHADRFLNLYMIIPVYYFIKKTDFNEKALWLGLFLGCITTVLYALYQSVELGVLRVSGEVHSIFFGSMNVFMGGIALLSFKRWKGWVWMVFPPISFLVAAISAVLSGSRISLVILVAFLILHAVYAYKLVSKKIIISGAVLTIVALISVYNGSGYVKNRIDLAVTHTVSALQNKDTDVNELSHVTSEGLRFEMWKAAWRMFKENPVVGVGWGRYNEEVKIMIKEGFSPKVLVSKNQPHNEYFSALSRGGLIGFLSLLLVFLVPLSLFYRQISLKNQNRHLAFAGFMYVLGFMILGLTADPFQTSRSILSFSFYTAVLMALMNKDNLIQEKNT